MKRIICLVLVILLTVSLVACGGKDAEKQSSSGEGADGKIKLTLASFVLAPEIEEKVNEFNSTNKDYFIEVIDYSQYNTDEDFTAGKTKLNTDILGGNIPDMIELGKMPVERFTNKGLLEDLTPYIESDPKLGKGSLVEGAIKPLSDKDGLHRVAPSFMLIGLYGKQSKIGDASSWNFDEMRAFLDKNSDVENPFVNTPIDSILPLTIEQFINEDGSCNFNSPEFISLLSTIKEYESKAGAFVKDQNKALLDNQGLLATMYLGGIAGFAQTYSDLGGDMSMIGNPTNNGSGNIADFQFSYGMFADSKNKEGCWQFLRTFLDEEYQSEVAKLEIPILKSVFDKSIESSDAPQKVKDNYIKVVNETTKSFALDTTAYLMIQEELKSLYDGTSTPEQIAETIQKKISIYLSEKQ